MSVVNYEIKNRIGILTIDRAAELNALNRQVLAELDAVIGSVDPDEVYCLVITGAGDRAFAAGADISEMVRMDKTEAMRFSRMGNQLFGKIENLPVPVIAAVDGYALGGGCELALSCDLRFCTERSVFGQPETGLGITPGFGGTQRLARIVGPAKAKEMIYTAAPVKAADAGRIGLVNEVWATDGFWDRVLKVAERICQNAPVAVRLSKQAIQEHGRHQIAEGVKREELLFGCCFETADQKHGMRSFLEKKRYCFQNR